MGQKVNPVGFRLGFNKTWSAHWFGGSNYANFLQQDDKIRTAIETKHKNAGISEVDIFRSHSEITITIHTSKPGMIIGRGGSGAQELKQIMEGVLNKFYPNELAKVKPTVRISIVEVKVPELSAKVVAENIANQIERRISVKRVIRQAKERTMEKRAMGIKIKISGRLNGAEIARSESITEGSIPLQTLRSDISYALAEAHTTYGVIGVKVWIYLGDSETMPLETASNSKFL